MNPALRNIFTLRLKEDIEAIGPAARFEQFGATFLDYHLSIPLNHRGLTLKGNPVGHTVDTVSDTGDRVGEYSSEEKYFDGKLAKLRSDLKHSLAKHPNVKDIYLLSAKSAKAAVMSRIIKVAGRCSKRGKANVHMYDASRISQLIVDDLLHNDAAVRHLAEYTPRLKGIAEEFASNLLVPRPNDRYCARASIEREVIDLIERNEVVSISGIGGSGKSQLAAAIVEQIRGRFDNVFWLDANELARVEDLHAIDIARSGSLRNLIALLQTMRCLLILDDVGANLDEAALQSFCANGSRIVITRRSATKGAYTLPPADEELSLSILNNGVNECPPPIVAAILGTVGGHPLALSLMNSAVREGASWDEINEDVASCGEFIDDAQYRVADRVLQRLLPNVGRELSLFGWLASGTCDRQFAKFALSPVGLRKLDTYCLTSPARGPMVQLHDVVYACVARSNLASDVDRRNFESLLATYIGAAYERDLDLFSLSTTHWRMLAKLLTEESATSSFLLALLFGWGPRHTDLTPLSDPMRFIRALDGRVPNAIELAVPMEAMEVLYRIEKETEGYAEAQKRRGDRLVWLDELEALPGLPDELRASVLHHRGKSLLALHREAEALAAFESALQLDPRLHAAKLQLVRIFGRDESTAQKSGALVLEILDAADSDPTRVTTSVALATAAELMRIKNLELAPIFEKYGRLIQGRILYAAEIGSDQAYRTFSALGRVWAYNDPDLFISTWRLLPKRTPEEVDSPRERFSVGDVLREAAARLPLPEAEQRQLQEQALSWFLSLPAPDAYERQTLGKLYVEMGRFEEAEKVLLELAKNEWVHYWLAKVYLSTDRAPQALEAINTALTSSGGNPKFMAAFLALRYDIRVALGDADAMADIDAAIDACTTKRFRAELEQKRAQSKQ